MAQPKIMIVEDEPLINLALQETLEHAGYSIVCTSDSADEVLRAYSIHKPDLVLLDVRLRSYTDGTDAARRLRLITNIPLIFITAYNTDEVRARAEKSQPVAFLTKPIDDDVLLSTVAKALNGRVPGVGST